MKNMFDKILPGAGKDNDPSSQDPQNTETERRKPDVIRYDDGTEIRKNYNKDGKQASVVIRRPDGTGTIEVNGVEVAVGPEFLPSLANPPH